MKAHCLPFSQIPHATRLFTDFLSYTPSVRPFYPHSPNFSEWMKAQASGLQYDSGRREQMSRILTSQNEALNASQKTMANIERLRRGAAAVVTGQQVGLLGGPMFSIYKALSAVKLAQEATSAGIDAVPIFWLATYDHDLEEVNHVSLPGADGVLRKLTTSSHGVEGAPVGRIQFGEEINSVVEEAAGLLGDSEVTQFLRESYRAGESFGSAFARLFARVFGEWGVILLDASDSALHRMAAPLYRTAIERAGDLAEALLARGQALDKADYFQQVKVTPSSVLLFIMRDGARTVIHRRAGESNGDEFIVGTDAKAEKVSKAELLDRVDAAPENFSPNVLLRPVVEDYLLPTITYAGGAAETAYFAQAGAVYELLLGRVTAIVPRFSATLVEPKVQRWLRQYEITVPEVFEDQGALARKLASHALPENVQSAFDKAQGSVESSLGQLRKSLEQLDATLVGASQTAGSKINYQLDRLRQLASAAELRRSEVVARHAQGLSQSLYPDGALQERGIAGVYFLARQGRELIQSLYDSMHTDCHDHQILEL